MPMLKVLAKSERVDDRVLETVAAKRVPETLLEIGGRREQSYACLCN